MRVLVSGFGGRMINEIVKIGEDASKNVSVVGGIYYLENPVANFPLFYYFDKISKEVIDNTQCVIDFSHHSVTIDLLNFCVKNNLPIVLCTTGHTEQEKLAIKTASAKIPVFYSANMSLGVAVLCDLAKKAVKAFPDADVEIVEAHHNRKVDAPSGTALMLADAIKTVRKDAKNVVGRSGQKKREKDEIGIHALRMGNVVGEHQVIVATDTQTITIGHSAHTRALFADGAVVASEYLIGKTAGLYDMNSLVREK